LAGKARAYFVKLQAGEPRPHPEDGEAFGAIVALSPKDMLKKIQTGEIRDGFTLSACQLAQARDLLSFK
jgi:hypothetical protein